MTSVSVSHGDAAGQDEVASDKVHEERIVHDLRVHVQDVAEDFLTKRILFGLLHDLLRAINTLQHKQEETKVSLRHGVTPK